MTLNGMRRDSRNGGFDDFLWEIICTDVACYTDSISSSCFDLFDDSFQAAFVQAISTIIPQEQGSNTVRKDEEAETRK